MTIEGIDVWYVLPAVLTAWYYWMRDWGWLPSWRRSKPEAVSCKLSADVPRPAWGTPGVAVTYHGARQQMQSQRDALRAMYLEQSQANAFMMTPEQMGPVPTGERLELLGQLLGKNGVGLEPRSNGLMVSMGPHKVVIPQPRPGYLIPEVSSAIEQLWRYEVDARGRALAQLQMEPQPLTPLLTLFQAEVRDQEKPGLHGGAIGALIGGAIGGLGRAGR